MKVRFIKKNNLLFCGMNKKIRWAFVLIVIIILVANGEGGLGDIDDDDVDDDDVPGCTAACIGSLYCSGGNLYCTTYKFEDCTTSSGYLMEECDHGCETSGGADCAACTPWTCGANYAGKCGTELNDNCGDTIDCGCPTGKHCSTTAPGVTGTCVPDCSTTQWHCKDSTHKARKNTDCSWNTSTITSCPNGCHQASGQCSPTAVITAPDTANIGEQITFDGSGSSDPEGSQITYNWNGEITGTGPEIIASFATAGERTVTLTVTDDKGATGTAQHSINVSGQTCDPGCGGTNPCNPCTGSETCCGGTECCEPELCVGGACVECADDSQCTDPAAPDCVNNSCTCLSEVVCNQVCCDTDQQCHPTTGECCTPKTCFQMGFECGSGIEDGCGTTIDCPNTCGSSKTCSGTSCECKSESGVFDLTGWECAKEEETFEDCPVEEVPCADGGTCSSSHECISCSDCCEENGYECGSCENECGEILQCGSQGECENEYMECNSATKKCECMSSTELCPGYECGEGWLGECLYQCPFCGTGFQCKANECVEVRGYCSDGTPYAQCSENQPWYCTGQGELIEYAEWCGCPSGEMLHPETGECVEIPDAPEPEISGVSVSLDKITHESAVVEFSTDLPTKARVYYWKEGRKANREQKTSGSAYKESHSIELTGLEANTKYFYAVEAWSDVPVTAYSESPNYFFTTAEKEEEEIIPGGKEGNRNPEITEIIVEPEAALTTGVPEGTALEFDVVVEDDDEKHFYDWASGAEYISSEKKAMHYFDFEFEPGETERVFIVTVFVKDPWGGFARGDVEVKILKANAKAKLLKPNPEFEEKLAKERNQQVEFELLDSGYGRIPLEKVLSVKAEMKGKKLIISEDSESGTIKGVLNAEKDFRARELLEIEAEVDLAGGKEKIGNTIPIEFMPMEIEIGAPFDEANPLYLNSEIRELEIRAFFSDRTPVKRENNPEIIMRLISVNERKTYSVRMEDGEFVADVDYVIGKSDLASGVMLKFEGGDLSGNRVREGTSFLLPIGEENPNFDIEIISPQHGEVLGFGQLFKIRAKVNSRQEEKLENVRLWIETEKGERLEFRSTGDHFELDYLVPKGELASDSIVVQVEGEGEIEGKKWADFEEMRIHFSNKAGIELVFPGSDITELAAGGAKSIKVKLFYPNGGEMEREIVRASVKINHADWEEVVFYRDEDNNCYSADLKENELSLGKNSLGVRLEAPFQGSISAEPFMSQGFQPELFAGLIIALIAFFFLLNFERRKISRRTEEREKFRERIDELEGLLKRLKVEYLRRNITEEEYRKRHEETIRKLQLVRKEARRKKF